MRQGQQHRRGRSRGSSGGNGSHGHHHRKGQNPLARSFESNGPDVKVRGTAADIAAKYIALARDAQSSGDPVLAENYLQHAEHYYRLINAHNDGNGRNRPGEPNRQPGGNGPEQQDGDGFEENPGDADSMQAAAARGQHRRFNGGGDRDEPGDDQP